MRCETGPSSQRWIRWHGEGAAAQDGFLEWIEPLLTSADHTWKGARLESSLHRCIDRSILGEGFLRGVQDHPAQKLGLHPAQEAGLPRTQHEEEVVVAASGGPRRVSGLDHAVDVQASKLDVRVNEEMIVPGRHRHAQAADQGVHSPRHPVVAYPRGEGREMRLQVVVAVRLRRHFAKGGGVQFRNVVSLQGILADSTRFARFVIRREKTPTKGGRQNRFAGVVRENLSFAREERKQPLLGYWGAVTRTRRFTTRAYSLATASWARQAFCRQKLGMLPDAEYAFKRIDCV